MTNIKRIIIIVVGLFVVFLISIYIYLGVYKPSKVLSLLKDNIYQNNADTTFIFDNEAEKFEKGKTLHFVAKHKIAKGKYGFVKKIEIKKKSGISIVEHSDIGNCDGLIFGVYKDSKCNEAIKEKMGKNMADDLNVKVEKGVYYIGIHTTDITNTSKIPVLVDCCYLYPKVTLQEKKLIYYCVGDKDQENTFSLVAKKTGRIRIRGVESFLTYTTMKNEKGQNVKNLTTQEIIKAEEQLKVDPDNDDFWSIYPEFNVEKGKKYILKIKWGRNWKVDEKNPEIIKLNYEYANKG